MPGIGILLIFEVFGVCAIEAGNGFFSRRCTHLLKGFVGHCLGISIEFDLPSQKNSDRVCHSPRKCTESCLPISRRLPLNSRQESDTLFRWVVALDRARSEGGKFERTLKNKNPDIFNRQSDRKKPPCVARALLDARLIDPVIINFDSSPKERVF